MTKRQSKTGRRTPRRLKRVVIPAARIFSGDTSVKMWEEINGAKTIRDLRMALYVVCCRIQELEEKAERKKRV